MCVQAHGQVRDSERSPAPPPRGKSQPLWLSVSSSVQWETTIPNHLGQRKWSKALAPASGRATVPQSLSDHSCASPHVVGRPQLGHVVSISPSKGTAHFHIPSPVPENALPGGHLRSCVTHGATETVCQARDVQPTHILRAPASSRSAQDGVAPRPAPPSCSPPSSAHPIPPSQSRSEPCRAGPPKMDGSWSRVLTKHGPLEEGMTIHSSILDWRAPWTVKQGSSRKTPTTQGSLSSFMAAKNYLGKRNVFPMAENSDFFWSSSNRDC